MAMNKKKPLSYIVTITDSGKWLHSLGSDFLFAFLKKSWSTEITIKMTTAFENALPIIQTIKDAVKETSGRDVKNGLYLLDEAQMTKAMNSIPGMGQTSVSQKHEQGEGTVDKITQKFFTAVLEGLKGDVVPIDSFLTQDMGNIQAQLNQSTVTKDFGTIVGVITLMPTLDVPVTTFRYVFSSKATSSWFKKLDCASSKPYTYDYKYTVALYNYQAPM